MKAVKDTNLLSCHKYSKNYKVSSSDNNSLIMFEKRILRSIFGTKLKEIWSKYIITEYNQCKLYCWDTRVASGKKVQKWCLMVKLIREEEDWEGNGCKTWWTTWEKIVMRWRILSADRIERNVVLEDRLNNHSNTYVEICSILCINVLFNIKNTKTMTQHYCLIAKLN